MSPVMQHKMSRNSSLERRITTMTKSKTKSRTVSPLHDIELKWIGFRGAEPQWYLLDVLRRYLGMRRTAFHSHLGIHEISCIFRFKKCQELVRENEKSSPVAEENTCTSNDTRVFLGQESGNVFGLRDSALEGKDDEMSGWELYSFGSSFNRGMTCLPPGVCFNN